MNIVKKIEVLRQDIITGKVNANVLASDGIEAMRGGMQRPVGVPTPEWAHLMEYITKDQAELDRLCGLETRFNQSRWGLACVAYIAGNSLCTSETATATGTIRAMSIEMIKNLDAEASDMHRFDDNGTLEAAALADERSLAKLDR